MVGERGLAEEAVPASVGDSTPTRRSVPHAFLRRLLNVGVDEQVEVQLALRVRVGNGLALVNVAVCLFIAVHYTWLAQTALALGLMGSAASWMLVFLVNGLGWYRTSRLLVVVLFLGNIIIYVGLLGGAAGLQQMCFAVSVLGCFLFVLDDWQFWLLGTALSIGVYFFSEPLVRPWFPHPMLALAQPRLAVMTTFVELGLVAYVFALESRRSFRALRRETQALRAARAEALSAVKTKSEFLATMSHELRTPLNGVIGMTQLLELTSLNPEQREQLHTLSVSSEYLMSLLDGVLDLNKVEAGRMELENASFELRPAVQSVVSLLATRAEKSGLKLLVQIEPDCPEWIFGDQRRLQQILFNLAGNGIKFTEHGSVSILVCRSSTKSKPNSAALEFEVRDTGIGMSEEEVERVFAPFTQANATIARRFGGTGLGLAISQALAQLMGGSLSVTSEPGRGSRFLLKLSCEERLAPLKAVAPVGTDSLEQPLGLRVLLAEDNLINQKVVSAFLRVLGCECDVVPNGRAALERLEQQSFDIILMDCLMPELDGVATTERIRESGRGYSEIPIVALTANVLDSERERCRAAGMNGYLTKPLARAVLREALVRYTSRSRDGSQEGSVSFAHRSSPPAAHQ